MAAPAGSRRFQVMALVLGPYLPRRLIEGEGGVRFGPLSPEAVASLPTQRGIVGSAYDQQLYSVRAPYTQVNSAWGFVIDIEATDSSMAQERVENFLLPDLMSALQTLGDAPYRAEVVRVLDPSDDASARTTPLLDVGSFGYVRVEPLTARRREVLWRRRTAIGADATATAAAFHLRLAVALADYPDATGVATAAAAVLRYYLCIERIVQAVAGTRRRERRAEFEGAQSAVANQFAGEIAALSGTKAVAAIEKAARELRAVDLRFADLEIREAAHILALDDEVTDEAVALQEFRAKHLAHSSVAPAELVRAWIAGPDNRAFRVATRFLGAYLDHITSRSKPTG